MNTTQALQFDKDLHQKKLTVIRFFDAAVSQVWDAWTKSELLDQWWAPEPWKAETSHMDFSVGGYWLYSMVGPDQTRHWARVDYTAIDPVKSFEAVDSFCDENGRVTEDLPGMEWKNVFKSTGNGTTVTVEIFFKSVADLEKIIAMGFREGFTSALNNLDRYISTHFKMRKEMKPDNKARVTNYLNFPGTTEEAFNFYKSVFNGQFRGKGLQRFGDIDLPADAPPMSEADKKLIIHAELTILGNYVLMATDATESMGFNLVQGNNMHINLEPESREETQRLFDALADGGTVHMPLQDMFWGAFFGQVTDRFGINWMFNYQEENA